MKSTLIRNVALAVGVNITPQTPERDVLDLIGRLKPLHCGKDLIRIGGNGDGGYLVPDDLEGIEYCFSPGVGLLSDFEDQLATYNIKSFLADYSVDHPAKSRPEFTFDKRFLGANDSETTFTLQSWMNKYLPGYKNDLLLEMDIDGSEYEVILGTPLEVLSTFRIMVIEFHFLEKLFDPFTFRLYRSCFEKLLKCFYVAHAHPNNACRSVTRNGIEVPRMMEYTFYNKKRVAATAPLEKFPHPLDQECDSNDAPLRLPRCWYQSQYRSAEIAS